MKKINLYVIEKLKINKDSKIESYNLGDILYYKDTDGDFCFFRIEKKINDLEFELSHLYSKFNKPILSKPGSGEYWWTDKFKLNKDNKFEFNGNELILYNNK